MASTQCPEEVESPPGGSLFALDPTEAAIKVDVSLTSELIARIALGCIQDKKAKNVRVLDISGQTILADYFLICTADSDRQSRAIVNEIYAEMKKRGLLPIGNETPSEAQWSLLDYGTVVVHVFQPEARVFYDLDNYWCDGEEVKLEPISPSTNAQTTSAQ